MKNRDLCPHCKKDHLVIVAANEPWNDEHLACPSCDSTYLLRDCCSYYGPPFVKCEKCGGRNSV